MALQIEIPPAVAYARAHALHALVIAVGTEIVAQEYGDGFDAEKPHLLYSGTKSFWGPAAVCARDDGLLELDEPVAATFPSWQDDPWKRRVTLRMLLSLTAGFGFGGLGAAVPEYERALALPLKDEPATRFTYGGIPFQVFGAVLARKLADRKLTPHDYLRERVLNPAGIRVSSWRSLKDGTHPLPTGASLRATDWLAYGRYVAGERERLAPCFAGSSANARYGLGWWLGARPSTKPVLRSVEGLRMPEDLVYASGSAGQALYVVPSLDLTIVHFGASASFRHETFLRRLALR